MEVFVVRNGETEAEVEGKFEGHSDTPLTDSGIEQVRTLSQKLSDYEFEVLFSSPLKRALDTAKIIAQAIQTDIRMSEELRDICYGKWEKKSEQNLQSKKSWSDYQQNRYEFQFPGAYQGVEGESYAERYPRVVTYFDNLLQSDYERIVTVTHPSVLRNIKKHYEGCTDDEVISFTPNVMDAYILRVDGDEVKTELVDIEDSR